MENKHPYKQWENKKPRCEEFGFSENDIPRINRAIEMYESSFEPSDKLKALRKKHDEIKRRDLDNFTIILSIAIIVLGFFALTSGGFTKLNLEAFLYAIFLSLVIGIFLYGIVASIVSHIVDPIEARMNKEYFETGIEVSKVEGEEKRQYEQYIEAKYGRDYALSSNLNSYYKALDYYNDCRNASRSEYWNKFQGGDGNDFERACAKFLSDRGFSARVTPIGPDKGIDIFAERDGLKYACQCKALGSRVSSGDIQRFIGVLVTGPYEAGFFFSLNGFSLNAIEVARTSPKTIYCLSKKELMQGRLW